MINTNINFGVSFAVDGANPNGDPLNENFPRITYEDGKGEVTAECMKRKIRDRLLEMGENVLIRKEDSMKSIKNRLIKDFEPITSEKGVKFDKLDKSFIIEESSKKYIDVRLFGEVIPLKIEGSKRGLSIGVKGPISFMPIKSIKPINVTTLQITKSVNMDGDSDTKASDTFGRRYYVNDNIYVVYAEINRQASIKSGLIYDDVDKLKYVLTRLFENDASSARPAGTMEVMNVAWYNHKKKDGDISSGKLYKRMKVDDNGDFTIDKEYDFEIIPGF